MKWMDFFWFAIYDVDKDEYFVARDHGYYSIIQLGSTRNFYVASELKALEGYCTKIQLLQDIIWQVKMENLYNGTKENGLIMML
jgi:asparagine synthetase B (glutamine-hydrolysing)